MAFAPVAGAMVIDILTFFEFGNHCTTAVTAGHKTVEQEVMLLASGWAAGAFVHHLLHLFEEVLADDGGMVAVIQDTLPVEVTIIDGIVQKVIHGAFCKFLAALTMYQPYPFGFLA
ncbi:MAG: hypothetical protein WCP20_15785 [Desulfuromonadales bacterium]